MVFAQTWIACCAAPLHISCSPAAVVVGADFWFEAVRAQCAGLSDKEALVDISGGSQPQCLREQALPSQLCACPPGLVLVQPCRRELQQSAVCDECGGGMCPNWLEAELVDSFTASVNVSVGSTTALGATGGTQHILGVVPRPE
jgi:hypothetical protein